ncbi:hypothetical protein ACQR1I_29625 [Bradyrhizobium sp. HKCCYLS2038]|uniref:hypothetical protein n=1 Tax=unclassified Bradyrhizobium TaxID=2631580 RepID=UPI003EC0D735
MPKLVMRNSSEKEIHVVIEPWADFEIVPTQGELRFEYEDFEIPPALEVEMIGDGKVTVFIMSETIKITGSTSERIYSCRESPE